MKQKNDLARYPDWVEAEKTEAHVAIFAQIREFDAAMSAGINVPSLRGLRAYLGRGIPSINNGSNSADVDVNGQLGVSPSLTKVSFNLTAVVIDTLAAKLASIEAVPQAVTFKGNSKGRQLADDLNFLLKGLFHKYDLSHMINIAYRDAMINRVGYLKVVKDNDTVRIEKVMADEIIIDNADGYYNKPYKMVQRKSVPIQVMLAKYPKFKHEIMDAEVKEVRQYNSTSYTPHIIVAESWCLNTYVEGGRHTITIETADLVDEEWNKDYFPVLKVDYNEPPIGWLGSSIVDELTPIQAEIDRLLIVMQAICKLMSVPRVMIDTNAQVNKNHITNKVGLILEYDGKQGVAPTIHNGAAMPPELMEQLQFLIAQGYARVGLTPMDTQGQHQPGTGNQSGDALNKMTDIKSERWALLQGNYEQKHIELAQIILNELQGERIKISALDRVIGLKEISTKVIPKTSNSYVLKMFPVSSLPDSIPELIESASKMLQLGVIQASQLPDLFNMPDLDSKISMISAPMRLLDKKIEQMLDTGKYWAPEPYHDLNYALQTAIQHYNWAQLHDEEEKKIALLRRFIKDVQQLKGQVVTPPQIAPTQVSGIPGQPTAPQPPKGIV